jgi:hypothetical protein
LIAAEPIVAEPGPVVVRLGSVAGDGERQVVLAAVGPGSAVVARQGSAH